MAMAAPDAPERRAAPPITVEFPSQSQHCRGRCDRVPDNIAAHSPLYPHPLPYEAPPPGSVTFVMAVKIAASWSANRGKWDLKQERDRENISGELGLLLRPVRLRSCAARQNYRAPRD